MIDEKLYDYKDLSDQAKAKVKEVLWGQFEDMTRHVIDDLPNYVPTEKLESTKEWLMSEEGFIHWVDSQYGDAFYEDGSNIHEGELIEEETSDGDTRSMLLVVPTTELDKEIFEIVGTMAKAEGVSEEEIVMRLLREELKKEGELS